MKPMNSKASSIASENSEGMFCILRMQKVLTWQQIANNFFHKDFLTYMPILKKWVNISLISDCQGF